ncbi:helix-turn-helix domain-containing protein [Parapedobacter koreensis]|uniref:Helix-turn-helix n=1 Tax=Parapedobacter koreensis TaxID=332977 RepID=A0A1H7NL95_9SPHI|nr:helix-turn-helix transcriptional regulator [Parapedobacter koreensis]SEL23758.1 Helix-turn-helix [Parapedobacter koreensis]
MAIGDNKFLKAFGAHFKAIREGKKVRTGEKISLRRLDQLSEVDHSQIHRIEKGESAPSIVTLKALADALGVSLVDLVTFDYD